MVLQATRAAHLDDAQTISWVWAVAVGSGISGLALSLLTRTPVIVAWSTPGGALLIASIGGFRFSDAVGAFLVASVCACVLGYTGLFGRLLALVPSSLMSALLAGILLPFIISGAGAVTAAPLVAGTVVASFVVAKRFADRYAVVIALAVGIVAAIASGTGSGTAIQLGIATPVFTMPTCEPKALITIGIPLLLITMAAQNAPGLTVLRNSGYTPDDRLLVGTVSLISALLTPFGGHATNLAAITAGICTGPASHPDLRRRYVAGIVCAIANLIAGMFATTLVSAYTALPGSMIAALAAVALLPSLIGALTSTLSGTSTTQTAAIITLAITASGVVILGIGSAFWGLLAGLLVWVILAPGARVIPPAAD